MSATVAIPASAVAISASNSAQISAQRRENCKLYVEGFDSKNAGVESQKHYAECVQLLNPDPMTSNEAFGMKVGIVVVLIAAVIGLVWGIKEGDSPADTLMMSFLGLILGACIAASIILVGVLAWSGIAFVFN